MHVFLSGKLFALNEHSNHDFQGNHALLMVKDTEQNRSNVIYKQEIKNKKELTKNTTYSSKNLYPLKDLIFVRYTSWLL